MLPLKSVADDPDNAGEFAWLPEFKGTIANTENIMTTAIIVAMSTLYFIKTQLKFKYLIVTFYGNILI